MAEDTRPVYEALLKAQQDNIAVALATVIETQGSMPRHAGSKMLIYTDGSIVGTVGGGAMESRVIQSAQTVISQGTPKLEVYSLNNLANGDPGICGGTAKIFIEPIGIATTLLIIGGGHVGKALAELGKWMGYRVILSDDRPEFCNPDYAPNLDGYVVCPPQDILSQVNVDAHTYIAAVTRGLPIDLQLLPRLLQTPAPYIGLIGSRRRWAITAKALQTQAALSAQEIARIRAPIGLELQAETPKEIALSICAEITMIQRGGSGEPMQWLGALADAE